MKRIIALFIFVLLVKNIAFCQNNEIEYYEYEVYTYDSIGTPILIEDPEYKIIATEDESTYGIKNRNGEIVIALGKYQSLSQVDRGMIIAQKDGKAGIIDITEKTLIPFIYDNMGSFSFCPDLAPVIKNGKQGFINRKGDIIIPLEYDADPDLHLGYFYKPGLAILMKNGKYGVIDSCNNTIIPFKYPKIEWFSNQDCFIITNEKKWACFSFEGKPLSDFSDYIIISQSESSALPANNRLNVPISISTSKHQKEYAYIDKSQHIIVPFGVYDYIEPFGLGRKAIVANKGRYGIIDEHGKLVLPLTYDLIKRPSRYSDYANIFVATKGNKITILNEHANAIPAEGIVSYRYGNADLLVSDIHNKKGRVNYNGQLTIPFEYDTLFHFNDTTIIATKGNRYGLISRENQIIKPFEYRKIYQLTSDLVFINKEGKAGIYDEEGKIKIPFEYDAIYDTFYNDFDPLKTKYIVIKEGKVGTIDIHNNIVIPIIYDGLSGWVEYGPDAHFVKNKGKYGLISHEGKIIIPIEYDYVDIPLAGVIRVRRNGKYGVISWKNEEILPCIYDNLINDIPYSDLEEQEGKLAVLQNEIWSYYDLKGNLIRKNIPIEEIMGNYGNRFAWGEPSNEKDDFDIHQANKNY